MSDKQEPYREKRAEPEPASASASVGELPTVNRRLSVRRARCARAKLVLLLATALGLWLWVLGTRRQDVLPTRLPLEDSFIPWPVDIDSTDAPAAVPNNESAVATSRRLARRPHMAGTPNDFASALDFLHLLQTELGIAAPPEAPAPVFSAGSPESRAATLGATGAGSARAAWVDTYYPVLNAPAARRLEILGEGGAPVWSAQLEERAEGVLDPDAGEYAEAVPAFHGLSPAGEVQGKLVYANYGRKEDYDALEEAGVDFNGSIVIARYGGIFRGLKVKGAQERGAVGCLIYSDPRDDGSVRWSNGYAAYPYGPARNPTSVQRGSVQFISVYPGDPTTPGYPSYENSTRTRGENIPDIPSLPISWNTANQLLEEIGEGGLNRTVKLVNNGLSRPFGTTMGVIPGHIKDEVVVVGNHRDCQNSYWLSAWVLGATDPTSGTVSTYEVVRGLGALLRKGWKPLRTIVIASWDAEEFGLIGSTEWGEDFAEWIDKYVVAYLNLDSSVSGSRLRLSASPSLAHLVSNAARDIPHPTIPGRTLWQARLDSGPLFGTVNEEAMHVWEEQYGTPLLEPGDFAPADSLGTAVKGGLKTDVNGVPVRSASTGVGALGSGSDYTVFLQRIGVASSNGGFASTLSDPVYHYHSVFDSETWQERYGDPGFHRHVAVAKHLGLQLLRIADAIVLPLNTTQYAYDLDGYLNKVEDIAGTQGFATDFSALRSSIAKLQNASLALDEEKADAEKHLRKLVKKWWKVRHGHHKHWWHKIRTLLRKIGSWFGFGKNGEGCPHKNRNEGKDLKLGRPKNLGASGRLRPRVGRYPAWLKEQEEKERSSEKDLDEHHGHHWHSRPKLVKKLIAAAKRVQEANKKLVAFERGFISEEGVKDREWYRHLGVAPGKWLGYGATTFPGVTEALIYDKNATLAQAEAKRLEKLIDALVKRIEV
ncbi:Zn-dependent exopeptidase [Phellopilus nigrolimitatus]|nr:Zn-dependent exopeptidase [Phellopilus nigrolimitatus]